MDGNAVPSHQLPSLRESDSCILVRNNESNKLEHALLPSSQSYSSSSRPSFCKAKWGSSTIIFSEPQPIIPPFIHSDPRNIGKRKNTKGSKRIQQGDGINPSATQDSKDGGSNFAKTRTPKVHGSHPRNGGCPLPSETLQTGNLTKSPKPNKKGALHCKSFPPLKEEKN